MSLSVRADARRYGRIAPSGLQRSPGDTFGDNDSYNADEMPAKPAERPGSGASGEHSLREQADRPAAERGVSAQESDLHVRERQLRAHNAVLTRLSLSATIEQGDALAAQREITEAAANALDVQRVSLWVFNEDRSAIHCIDLYERDQNRHTAGLELAAADYPRYFEALCEDRCVPAHDAREDPRTSEFIDSYLEPLRITSMLDAPVRVGGRLVGVVCHEHVGPPRRWTLADQTFAGSMADIFALTLQAAQRREAEQTVEKQRAFLRQLIDINPNLIYVKDRDGRFMLVNQAVADMYGTSVDDLVGKLDSEIHPDADEVAFFRRIDQAVMNSLRQHVIFEEAITDAAGRVRWLQTVKRPVIGKGGKADQVLGVSVDITERKLAQERQELMVRELDHRVKNNLSTVLGLAEQTALSTGSIEQFLESFSGRIRSMAIAHELLATTNWQGAVLREMIERLLEPFSSGMPGRVSLQGTHVLLPPRVAPPLCMVLHELATNAAKHGSLSIPDGQVDVSWASDGQRLRLQWREGGGPHAAQPQYGGFGMELIAAATRHQLRGTAQLQFEPAGVQCTIDIPLALDESEIPRDAPGRRTP